MDKTAFYDLSYGLFILGVMDGDRPSGCTVNTVFQLTSEPATLAISLNHQNHTTKILKETGRIMVNVLDQDVSMDTIGTFGFHSGRDTDKFAAVPYRLEQGLPVPEEHICAWFSCRVKHMLDMGSHVLFVVDIEDAGRQGGGSVPPLTYAYYRSAKKGTLPKTAPHYIAPEQEESGAAEKKWVCTICNYEYDGSAGPFEDLPDSWTCPLCGVPKAMFEQR